MGACGGKPENAQPADKYPEIYPDFSETTFPPNISAPTFLIKDDAHRYFIEIGVKDQEPLISISSSSGVVKPNLKKWHGLMEEAAGKDIYFRITLVNKDSDPIQLKDISCHVSEYPIDQFLIYRLLYPGYELWNEMGIYQRNLTDYRQDVILENNSIDKQCVNCHSFSSNAPETMMVHVRGKNGGTLIRKDGQTKLVNPKCPALENGATYPSWHPSGDFIAFSANNIQQFFHSKGSKTIEVTDLSADMTIYDVRNEKSFTSQFLSGDEYMETFPNWSPDGRTLYFCRAKGYIKGEPLDSIRYDLCKVSFNPESLELGEPEVIFNASEQGKSVSFPRVSPDGRWLIFTLSDYGNFSIWHPESDLWLLDLNTNELRNIHEINSEDVDSYHSWSSNGRWIVFSSKRMDGLWARPFISAFNPETGQFGIPFVVPQNDPNYYDDFMKTYNVPELVQRPVVNTEEFINIVNRKQVAMPDNFIPKANVPE